LVSAEEGKYNQKGQKRYTQFGVFQLVPQTSTNKERGQLFCDI